jgi:tRNA nucleotidyltransferase/poly(A) polymerase
MNIQTLTEKIKNDDLLNNLTSFFPNEIYLVGGDVRDMLMGKTSTDRDLIVVDEDAREFSLKVAEFFHGVFIPLDEKNKIYRIVLEDKENYFDITNPIENSLEKDMKRRDLSLNAIAVNIRTGDIVDLCGGIQDIQDKVIRGIKEENFTDDPLRLLRIFRFHALLGFEIDNNLIQIAKKYSILIKNPAKERIEYELMKLFSGKYAHSAILKMDEAEILEKIFPFVKELKHVPKNWHHHLDLFHHSVETVRQVEILYQKSSPEVKCHMDRVDFGGFSRIAHLKLACFLHDMGKFATWTIEPDGRHRFIGHDEVGSKLALRLLKSLKFSNKQIEYIRYIIKKHMYPTAVVSSPELTEKVMMRYVRKSQDNAIDNILIAQADRLSARGPQITEEDVNQNITALNRLLNFYLEIKETLIPLPKLIDGNDIMEILGIEPSKRLGEILSALNEAQVSGEVVSKEDAVNFVKNYPKD